MSATNGRYKLPNDDIVAVSSVTVSDTPYTELSATNQSGNVYFLNKTKGWIEFITAPGANPVINYTYYPRAYTQNPASHLVYLLTSKFRGKGLDPSRIDWAAAVALRDYCDQTVFWANSSSTDWTRERYICNYAIDVRKPIEDHLRAVLDSCYAELYLINGKFTMKARKAESSVFSFTESNILKGSFSSEMVERSPRPNQIKVFFHSATTLNTEAEARRDDITDQRPRAALLGNDGILDETLKLPAVDNFVQAERWAETFLRESVNRRWICELSTTVKGLALEPLDVVDVTHSSQPTWTGKLFRIEHFESDENGHIKLYMTEYFAGAYI